MITRITVDIPSEIFQRAIDFCQKNEDWDGDRIVGEAVDRFLITEERGSTEIPADLLRDLIQVCHWLHGIGSAISKGEAIDADLLEVMTSQAKLVQIWASEYGLVSDPINH